MRQSPHPHRWTKQLVPAISTLPISSIALAGDGATAAPEMPVGLIFLAIALTTAMGAAAWMMVGEFGVQVAELIDRVKETRQRRD